MSKFLVATTSIFGLLAVQGFAARADEALDQLAKDPKQWVMQQGDDANTRYSKLNQITASNVKGIIALCRRPPTSRSISRYAAMPRRRDGS